MSARSKAMWRANNPERRRQRERERSAKRRRHGRIIEFRPGQPPVVFSYPSGESNQRYEQGSGRFKQRWRYYIRVILPGRIAAKTAWLAAFDAQLDADYPGLTKFIDEFIDARLGAARSEAEP